MSEDDETRKEMLVRHLGSERTTIVRSLRQESVPFPEDAAPLPAVHVVTDEDKRFDKALQHKAQSPTDFIRDAWRARPPLVDGARVSVETMLGFLCAIEKLLPSQSGHPVLSSVKLSFETGQEPKLFIEGGSHSVWTAIAIRAESSLEHGFKTLLPLKRGARVLKALSSSQELVVVGVDKGGVCLGAHSIPFSGLLQDFPAQPVMVAPIAQVAMPGFYFEDIVEKVMPAKSITGVENLPLQGVLLDFEPTVGEEGDSMICTAVAMDGMRLHILRLPRMVMKNTSSRTPPALRVSGKFFQFLREVVNSKWTLLEFSADQIVAKGEDFIVVAKATPVPKNSPCGVGDWRKLNYEYDGCWMIDRERLEAMMEIALGHKLRLRLDSLSGEFIMTSEEVDGTFHEIRDEKHLRCNGGAPYVDVTVFRKFFLDAVRCCSSKMIRLEFEHNPKYQESSAIVIKGEDDNFKAVVMPFGERHSDA